MSNAPATLKQLEVENLLVEPPSSIETAAIAIQSGSNTKWQQHACDKYCQYSYERAP